MQQCRQCKKLSDKSVSGRSFLKPYWNSNLLKRHYELKQCRTNWLGHGRPRQSSKHFTTYKEAKREFQRLHWHFGKEFLKQQTDELDKSAEIDRDYFWRTVKSKPKGKSMRAGCE